MLTLIQKLGDIDLYEKFFKKILPNQHAIAKMCRALKIMVNHPGCNLSGKKMKKEEGLNGIKRKLQEGKVKDAG